MSIPLILDLPRITADLQGIGGRIKTNPEDFEVEEIPAYAPSGSGDYLYLWLEKRAMGAEFFTRQIARRLEVPVSDVGLAGLKDRHAITRQMVSVPVSCEANLSRLEGEGIRLLSIARHSNKLKPGHLRGNRFRILIRNVSAEAHACLPALLQRIRSVGMPNFYGSQRFGHEGETLQLGYEILSGNTKRRVNPFLKRFSLSAVQSALFNQYVTERIRTNVYRQVLHGDVMMKWPFGGIFVAHDVNAEQERFDRREIVPGGPMFGRKMFAASEQALELEDRVLQTVGITRTAFHGYGKLLTGTRRYCLVYLDDLEGVSEPDGIRLTFTLPSGSYATVLVRELTHTDSMDNEEST